MFGLNRYVLVNFLRTIRSSWRTYLMAAVMTGAAYGVFGSFFLLQRNVAETARYWVRSVPVTLVLDHESTPEQHSEILDRLDAMDATAAKLVTPEEGKARLAETSAGSQLLSGFDENPLPPMIEASFETPPPASRIALMRGWPGVEDVDDAGRWSERFLTLLRAVDRTGLFLGALLLLAAFTVAVFTVRLVAAGHASEREIQYLVGAPRAYVRAPYVIAGGALGLLGYGFAIGGLYFLYEASTSVPLESWPIPISAPVFFSFAEASALAAAAVVVGVAGGWAGIRKA